MSFLRFEYAKNASEDYAVKEILDYKGADVCWTGHYGIALQNALCQMLHASSFYDGMLKTIEQGGDTDTNGAIAGAMLGTKR